MLRFFTDPHLGRNATSHTTQDSRKRLDELLFKSGLKAATTELPSLCLGDLFHTPHNNESTIAHGIMLANECDLILEGNHDLPNRTNTVSSIGLIKLSGEDGDDLHAKFSSCKVGHSGIDARVIGGVSIVAIPHHSSQTLFDQAVEEAAQHGGELCLLHCNYNSPFDQGIETSLNLSEEQAERLAMSFDYLVLGHEHNFRWELDKKVLILGNTHPTSFHDLSDKYYWDYDPSDKSWHKTMIWRKDDHYKKIYLHDVLNGAYSLSEHIQFLDIVGKYSTSEESFLLSKAIQKIWETYPNLIMVRNNTHRLEDDTEAEKGLNAEDTQISANLKELIHEMVKGTHMEEAFLNYVKDVSND